MRFLFVGQLEFNTKEDAKVPAVRKIGDSGLGINATVIVSKNNRAYVEAVGWQNDIIKTKDTDGNNIDIDWDDRFDDDVIKSVVNYRKNVITDGDDRQEFITPYDFCEYIKDHIDELKDKRFAVTGQTQENFYNGKESKRFQINNLYVVDKDDERKNKLELTTVIYWNKESIDTTDFKEEKKIYINAYTQEYLSGRDLGSDGGENRYIPIQLILDCSRIDFENDQHLKMLKYNLMNLGLSYKDGKIVNNLKGKKYYSNEIVISYFNGAQDMGDAENITYDMLTDLQKMKVDCGLAKVEDFAAKGRSYGNRIVEWRITNFPNTTGTYQDGMVEVDDTPDEFEEKIFCPTASDDDPPFDMNEPEDEEEKPKKSKTKAKKEPEPEPEDEVDDDDDDDDDDLADLFG